MVRKSAEELRQEAARVLEAAKARASKLAARAQAQEQRQEGRLRKQLETRKIALARILARAVAEGRVDMDRLSEWSGTRVTRPSDRRAIGLDPAFQAANPKHRSLVWGGLVLQLLRDEILTSTQVQEWVDTYLPEAQRFSVKEALA